MPEPAPSRNACIVGRSTGVGLDRDAALVRTLLEECSLQTSWREPGTLPLGQRLSLGHPPDHDLLVFLERVFAGWHRRAHKSVLIPNQERFPRRQLGRLRSVDAVFCKTRHATEVFARHHAHVHHLGFTSPDRALDEIAPDYGRFLHLAGRSTLKGTAEVLATWQAHPDWPPLALVVHPDNAPREVPSNVELISRHLEDDALRRLQNRCGIHLCPSRSEGWGHYLAEAMSCHAVAVTTDAPPMNELVGDARGILVPPHHSERRHLGTNFHVGTEELGTAVGRILETPRDQLAAMGDRARTWFVANDSTFRARFHELVSGLLSPP